MPVNDENVVFDVKVGNFCVCLRLKKGIVLCGNGSVQHVKSVK